MNSQLVHRVCRIPAAAYRLSVRPMSQVGGLGEGAGKGGGGGGSIRSAGGAFGQMEAAREEQYFRKLQAAQIEELKNHLDEEVGHHEREIKRHQEAIARHNKRMQDIEEHKKKTEEGS